jgi:hypothetical protein
MLISAKLLEYKEYEFMRLLCKNKRNNRKYTYFFTILLFLTVLLSSGSCSRLTGLNLPKQFKGENSITMVTKSKNVNFFLGYFGDIGIDWGDGKKEILNNEPYPNHKYNNIGPHKIIIYGAIGYLYTPYNRITFLDVSKAPDLEMLTCSNNLLSKLDLKNNYNLKTLECGNNDLEIDTQPHDYKYDYNRMKKLDISNNVKLNHLSCSSMGLDTIIWGEKQELRFLNCSTNNLQNIPTENSPLLRYLIFQSNDIKTVDVSNNIYLEYLFCSNNFLSNLDLTNNQKLKMAYCTDNLFESKELNELMLSLHNNNTGTKHIYIDKNPGTEQCDKSIAENKGWRV